MAKRSQLPKPAGGSKSTNQPSRSATSRWLLLGVIAAVVVVAVGLILLATQATRTPVVATNRVGEGTAWGPADAPVKIVNFSDFGCSHCRDFALNQGQQLRAEYESSGKVRFEFRNFVLNWQTTADPANASQCAADQGRFWDYHDILFSQQGMSAQPFSRAALKQYAAQLGLDTAKFNPCVDNNQHADILARDGADGRALGVNATPTFFINGKKIEGAAPYATFKAAVDAALASGQ